MFFDLTDEQLALREMATDLFGDLAPLARLRGMWDRDERDGKVWSALAEAGLLGLGVSEDRGGSGGTEVDAAVVLEAAGHACLPEPIVATLGVAAPVLAATGVDDHLLAEVVTGRGVVGVTLDAPHRLDRSDDLDAAIVGVDGDVHLVRRDALELAAVHTWDRPRGLAEVRDVAVSDATRVDAELEQVRTRWWAGNAMALVGTAQRMLDVAVEHARVREQFGRPIGANQAVAHPLAAVHVELEAARAGAWHAALAHQEDPATAEPATRVAVVAAQEAARLADRVSLQVLGGIGFTWEHDLHMVLKHATATHGRLGPVSGHRAAVAAELIPR